MVGLGRTDPLRWLRLGAIFLLYFTFIVIPQLSGGYSDVHQVVRASVEFLFNSNIFVGSVLFAYEITTFYAFIEELRALATFMSTVSYRLKYILTRHNHVADVFAKVQSSVMGVIAFTYWIVPMFATYWSYYNRPNATAPLELVQHVELKFYWLDNRSSIRDYTIFVFIVLPVICMCSAMCNLKVLTISCSIAHCTLFTKLTIIAVEQLDDHAPTERLENDLSNVVRMHTRLLKCIQLLTKTLQSMLLIQWMVCGLNWSISLVYLTNTGITMKTVTVIVMFVLATLETFLYCALGSRLAGSAEQLERVIYAKRWYNYPVEMQKNVQIILRHSQKPVALTVGKFFRLGLEEFSRMVNLSYSAYVVLKDQIKMGSI